jgi:hypothetical protein
VLEINNFFHEEVSSFTFWPFYPQKKGPSTYWIEDWLSPKPDLDFVAEIETVAQPIASHFTD